MQAGAVASLVDYSYSAEETSWRQRLPRHGARLLKSGKGNVCHLQRGTSQECVDVAAVASVAVAVAVGGFVSIINWEQ